MKNHLRICHVFMAMIMMIGLGAVPLPAYAVHDVDLFELEGDAVDDGTVDGDDWENVFNGTASANRTLFIDQTNEEGADVDTTYFSGGGSKDDLDIPNWLHSSGDTTPDKDDITNAYAASYFVGTDNIIYMGFDRFATNGDANVAFWLFHDAISLNPDGTFNGQHTAGNCTTSSGDILVVSAFTRGGEVGTVTVYEWVEPACATVNGVMRVLYTADANGGEDPTCGQVDDDPVCAISNLVDATSPWPYTPKKGTDNIFGQGAFYEAGINLTALLGDEAVGCFSSFLAETRSSQSVDATLKDFALGSFQTCGLELEKTADVSAICDITTEASIGYNYHVTNTGFTALDVSVVDDRGTETTLDDVDVVKEWRILNGIPLNPGEDPQTYPLAGGADILFEIDLLVSGEVTNVATATGTAGTDVVTAQDDATVNVQQCTISITKEPDLETVCIGDTDIVYSFRLENTGSAPVEFGTGDVMDNNGSTDTSADDIDLLVENSVGLPLVLAAGEYIDLTLNKTLASETGTVMNEVTASGDALIEGVDPQPVSATASADVEVFDCRILIEKSVNVPEVCSINADVTYTYIVSNPGNADLSNIVVEDDKLGILAGAPTSLAAGADPVEFTVDTNLSSYGVVDSVIEVTNIVTANATSLNSYAVDQATDDATVSVHDCKISISKECDPAEGVGGSFTLRVAVTNTGTTALSGVLATDDTVGLNFPAIGDIAVGAPAVIRELEWDPEGDASAFLNQASVVGTALGTSVAATIVDDTTSAQCIVNTNPLISVTKACSDAEWPNGTIHFSGIVSNDGDGPLTNVTVYDSALGANVVDGIDLGVGASQGFEGSYEPLYTWNKNTVTASATDAVNPTNPVAPDEASAVCERCPFVANPAAGGTDSATSPGSLGGPGPYEN